MQPRSLQQILSELDTIYNPEIASIQRRQAQIPGQVQAEQQGLQAKQEQAFGDILGGARRRGLGFSGIPLQEQARYTATDYLPALARLQQSGREQAMSLEDAILGIQERRGTQAQSIFQQEQDRAQAARQAAAQQSSFANLFGKQQPQQPTSPLSVPGISLKNATQGGAGGYNFNFGGKPISAIGFSQVNNLNPADVLFSMANAGDTYAANAYKDIVANGGTISPDIARRYSALFWGTSLLPAQAPVQTKKKPTAPKIDTNVYPNANKVPGFLGIVK